LGSSGTVDALLPKPQTLNLVLLLQQKDRFQRVVSLFTLH
jgi:hypothetical protein